MAVVTLAVSLSAIVAALLGPAQTLAQTHRPACQSSAHARKRTAHTCTQPSHKVKAQARHAAKRHAKRTVRKKSKGGAHAAPAVAAQCEDGSAPVRAADGSFSCDDGSEPGCEGGATPASSRNGKSLLCPVAAEGEAGASETEAECEEEETPGCTPGASEQACEAAGGGGSSSVCEDES